MVESEKLKIRIHKGFHLYIVPKTRVEQCEWLNYIIFLFFFLEACYTLLMYPSCSEVSQ